MNARELQQALADNAIGKFDKKIEILDPDGFIHGIVTATWDDERDCFLIRTKYECAELIILEGD